MTGSERILVTGASGMIGRHLCPVLTEAGHTIVAGIRGGYGDTGITGETLVTGDLVNLGSFDPARLQGIRQIVHLAALAHRGPEIPDSAYEQVNFRAPLAIARAAAEAGCRRFTFISSIKVLGDTSPAGKALDDASIPAPPDAYSRAKRQAEQALAELASATGMDCISLRPPLVHAAEAGGNIGRLLKLCINGGMHGLPVPLGSTRNHRSLISARHLADAIRTVIEHPGKISGAYALADQAPLSTGDIIRELAAGMGRKAPLLPFPAGLLAAMIRLAGKAGLADRLLGDLSVDDRRFRRDFGWQSATDSRAELRLTGEEYARMHSL
jgi:nucleoside-diphosphate-sugar epimerase